MRIIARIPCLFRKELGEAVFADLLSIYPEGDASPEHHVFVSFLPLDDPRTRQITGRLENAGFRPYKGFGGVNRSEEYQLDLERQYDHADLVDCKFLRLLPESDAFNYDSPLPLDDGRLVLEEHDMPHGNFDVRGIQIFSCFVPARVRRILEVGNLVGLYFKSVEYREDAFGIREMGEGLPPRYGVPYWELETDQRMPPLSPSMTLLDNKGQPALPGTDQPVFPQEGLYLHPELHYRASDLEKIDVFDVARTFENFGVRGDRPMIVSKRFYDFFTSHGLKTGWVPVRIDPD